MGRPNDALERPRRADRASTASVPPPRRVRDTPPRRCPCAHLLGRPVRRPPPNRRRRPAGPRPTTASCCRRATRRRGSTRRSRRSAPSRTSDLLSLRRDGVTVAGPPGARAGASRGSTSRRGSLGQGLAVGLGHGARDADGRRAGPAWVPDGRLRDGRGFGLGGDGGGALPRGRRAHRRSRPEPARAARPDDARLARRRSSAIAPRRSAGAPIEIDGHDVDGDRRGAYRDAVADERPTLIVARTEKGHGVSFLADHEGWHGKAVPADRLDEAIAELGGARDLRVDAAARRPIGSPRSVGELRRGRGAHLRRRVATRKAFGETLAWLAGHRPELVVLDGEVGNSTHTEDVAAGRAGAVRPDLHRRAVHGRARRPACRRWARPRSAASFGAFSRARYDFRSAWARSAAPTCGCAVRTPASRSARTGPRRWRSRTSPHVPRAPRIHGAVPGRRHRDGQARHGDVRPRAASRTCARRARRRPSLYGPDEEFPIGGSKALAASDHDDVTLIGAGITLHACMAAAERARRRGRHGARDRRSTASSRSTPPRCARRSRRPGSSWSRRTTGSRAASATPCSTPSPRPARSTGRVVKLGVDDLPGSASPEQLRAWAGIDADADRRGRALRRAPEQPQPAASSAAAGIPPSE